MFTEEEMRWISRAESMGRWDHLLYDFSVLVPCFIIMAAGLYFSSPSTVIIGMVTFAVIRVWNHHREGKEIVLMKGILEKLRKQMIADKASEQPPQEAPGDT